MQQSVKEWNNLDSAIRYARRYAKGNRFAGVEVEVDGVIIFEITSDCEEIDHRINVVADADNDQNEPEIDKQVVNNVGQMQNDGFFVQVEHIRKETKLFIICYDIVRMHDLVNSRILSQSIENYSCICKRKRKEVS